MKLIEWIAIGAVAVAAWGYLSKREEEKRSDNKTVDLDIDQDEPQSTRIKTEVVASTPLFTAEVVTHTSEEYERARQLFKDATAASVNDSDQAVELFREACEYAERTDTDFGIEVYLRLPRYLQEGGRSDESWLEFNHLLTSGYPNMPAGDRGFYDMQAAVFDKMRLFFQREKQFSAAVCFGARSMIMSIRAALTPRPPRSSIHTEDDLTSDNDLIRESARKELNRQKKWENEEREWSLQRVKNLRDPEFLSDKLMKLLRRAKKKERHEATLTVLQEWAVQVPEADDMAFMARFAQALGGVSMDHLLRSEHIPHDIVVE